MKNAENASGGDQRVILDFDSFRITVEGNRKRVPDDGHESDASIEVDDDRLALHDPYVQRFWRAYLGQAPFALWELIASFTDPETGETKTPSIALLSSLMGTGDRHTILGRDNSTGAPQTGALTILEEEGIVSVRKHGSGRAVRYDFEIELSVPLLSPEAAETLSRRARRHHRAYVHQRFGKKVAGAYPPVSKKTRRRKLPSALREAILERDQYRCRFCGGPATTVDHIVPVVKGGQDEPENLVAACLTCNSKKNGRTPEEAGMPLDGGDR